MDALVAFVYDVFTSWLCARQIVKQWVAKHGAKDREATAQKAEVAKQKAEVIKLQSQVTKLQTEKSAVVCTHVADACAGCDS